MEGSGLVPSVRGMPRGVKAAWLIFAFAVCSVFAFVVYAEKAEAAQTTAYKRDYYGGICLGETSSFAYNSTYRAYLGRATTQSLDYSYCSYTRSKPAGYIYAQAIVYSYSSYYGWQLCTYTGQQRNWSTTYYVTATANAGYSGCGRRSHYTDAYGGVYSNGAWRNIGPVYSGQEYAY